MCVLKETIHTSLPTLFILVQVLFNNPDCPCHQINWHVLEGRQDYCTAIQLFLPPKSHYNIRYSCTGVVQPRSSVPSNRHVQESWMDCSTPTHPANLWWPSSMDVLQVALHERVDAGSQKGVGLQTRNDHTEGKIQLFIEWQIVQSHLTSM